MLKRFELQFQVTKKKNALQFDDLNDSKFKIKLLNSFL